MQPERLPQRQAATADPPACSSVVGESGGYFHKINGCFVTEPRPGLPPRPYSTAPAGPEPGGTCLSHCCPQEALVTLSCSHHQPPLATGRISCEEVVGEAPQPRPASQQEEVHAAPNTWAELSSAWHRLT